jgi:cell wall-associated NlpC family hydrolase
MITRESAVDVARSWVMTPYVLGGRVKSAGCDCGTLLAEWAIECGICTRESLEDIGLYSNDWFCNTSEERYLLRLIRHARKALEGVCRGAASEARPGCLVLFKSARSPLYNHGGIITDWPKIIHAVDPCVVESNATQHYLTSFAEMCIFDPWSEV